MHIRIDILLLWLRFALHLDGQGINLLLGRRATSAKPAANNTEAKKKDTSRYPKNWEARQVTVDLLRALLSVAIGMSIWIMGQNL